eukprot:s77_g19.t3
MVSRFVRRAARPAPVPEVEAPLVSTASPSGPKQLIEGKHKAPRCSIEVATHTAKNWGGRHENEDRCMASQDTLNESFPFHTVGVLDGHDTDSASDLVAKLLPGAVGRRIKEGLPIGQAYMEAMAEMEDKLKKEHATAGTCVNSCTIAGGRVWCANLGDCRAALVTLEAPSSGAVKAEALTWLSRDHKASCPIEQKRIEAVGGSPSCNVETLPEVILTSEETCVICLETMTSGQSAKQLACGHVFHGDCIAGWWQREFRLKKALCTTCPVCRCEAATAKPCSVTDTGHIVSNAVIDGRVEGLEPSRTLGDFDVKMTVKPGVISIVPEVSLIERAINWVRNS